MGKTSGIAELKGHSAWRIGHRVFPLCSSLPRSARSIFSFPFPGCSPAHWHRNPHQPPASPRAPLPWELNTSQPCRCFHLRPPRNGQPTDFCRFTAPAFHPLPPHRVLNPMHLYRRDCCLDRCCRRREGGAHLSPEWRSSGHRRLVLD